MANCPKCNAALEDGAKFCTACGEKVEAADSAAKTEAPQNDTVAAAADSLKKLNNTPDSTDQFDAADINDNKILAALSYLSWLVLIPLLVSKSRFVKFHANQGLILFIASFIVGVVAVIPILGWLVSFVGGIVTFVLAIIGIVNVVNGKAKQLPIIGKFTLIKY